MTLEARTHLLCFIDLCRAIDCLGDEWVAGALILFDLGFYDFWLFDRIDANDGWFVSRVKSNANPEIVEELRTWRENSITLEGKSLKALLDDLQRQEIDVLVELEFDRKLEGNRNGVIISHVVSRQCCKRLEFRLEPHDLEDHTRDTSELSITVSASCQR